MIWETLTNRFAVSTSIQKDANSWDFFELNFSPTIYPPIICLKRLFSATCQKKERGCVKTKAHPLLFLI